ncbi:hypothetical protein [Methanofollis aquaemaris]|uniref:hypothetical protein n=1 Tax=Methanofollis aquaemaris TaxID=126734 RepID=UPI00223F7746|nr:hypothetical protein [Methanofollis aquaemaris]
MTEASAIEMLCVRVVTTSIEPEIKSTTALKIPKTTASNTMKREFQRHVSIVRSIKLCSS